MNCNRGDAFVFTLFFALKALWLRWFYCIWLLSAVTTAFIVVPFNGGNGDADQSDHWPLSPSPAHRLRTLLRHFSRTLICVYIYYSSTGGQLYSTGVSCNGNQIKTKTKNTIVVAPSPRPSGTMRIANAREWINLNVKFIISFYDASEQHERTHSQVQRRLKWRITSVTPLSWWPLSLQSLQSLWITFCIHCHAVINIILPDSFVRSSSQFAYFLNPFYCLIVKSFTRDDKIAYIFQ